MEKYRLKKEALPFFDEKYHCQIGDLKYWNCHDINRNAIEKVENCRVEYGHIKDIGTTQLCGWRSSEAECHFNFRVVVPDSTSDLYQRLRRDDAIRDIMNVIQNDLNLYFGIKKDLL